MTWFFAPMALFAAVVTPNTGIASGASEMVVMAERPKLAIITEDITVNGQVRPEIAQALVDGLSVGLLKTGQFRVFSPPVAGTQTDGQLGSSSRGIKAMEGHDLDYVVTLSLLGDNDSFRLTMKKVRVSTQEVLEAHQFAAAGNLGKVFDLTPQLVSKLEYRSKSLAGAFPRSQSPAEIIAPAVRVQTIPSPRPAAPAAYDPWASVPVVAEYTEDDVKRAPKALIYQKLGAIQHIDPVWKFCIIRPESGLSFRKQEALHVLYDEDGTLYGDLRVSGMDSGKVIADFGRTPAHHPLFPGDEVFGWAPPAN